jgi:surface protein
MSGLQLTDNNIRDMVKKYMANDNDITQYGRIGEWDVSNVTNMKNLFLRNPNFNEDISRWNVSNVTNMESMFADAKAFNQTLDTWNVSNVTNMNSMFAGAENFNQPLDNWNVSNVTNMGFMFAGAKSFNQPLNNWNVGNVTNMGSMFARAESFNQPLDNWNVSNVTNMNLMFQSATKFNQPLNSWNVSNVMGIRFMFAEATSMQEENKPHTIQLAERLRPSVPPRQPAPIREPPQLQAIKQALQRTPQASGETINFSTEYDCYDIINGEDIPVKKALEDDNMVFVFYTDDIKNSSRVAIPIQAVIDAFEPKNLKSYIIYQCIIAGTMRADNINTTKPYFDIKKLTGFGDLIEVQNINPATQKVFIFKKSNEKLVSTVSYDALFGGGSYVSARHCQEGQGATIYKPVQFTLTSDPVGGRKIRKRIGTRKRRSSTRKRINTKKTVTKKRKTKKNKRS